MHERLIVLRVHNRPERERMPVHKVKEGPHDGARVAFHKQLGRFARGHCTANQAVSVLHVAIVRVGVPHLSDGVEDVVLVRSDPPAITNLREDLGQSGPTDRSLRPFK